MTATLTKPATDEAPQSAERPDPGFSLVKSETLKLTKAAALKLAEEHSALPDSVCERELVEKHLQALVQRVRDGLLIPCCWSTVLFQGVKYRMNGQHSSRALLKAADWLPDSIVVHLDHYETRDALGMGRLFRQFDARFSSRSKADVSGAYQGLVDPLRDLDRKKCKLGLEGIGWHDRVVEKLPVPSDEDLYSYFFHEQYHAFLRWLDSLLNVKTPELFKQGVVAGMYETFLKSESGAQDFWSHVAKQDLPDDTDPRQFLGRHLTDIKEEGTKSRRVAPAEFYCKVGKAWNAFRGGDKMTSLNVNTKKGLVVFAS